VSERDLVIERRDGLVVLRLNRPGSLNAISAQMADDLHDLVPPLARDPTVRAILLTGAGRAFCAGADVTTMGSPNVRPVVDIDRSDSARERRKVGLARSHTWMKALRMSDAVLVTAVNGAADGGGFGMALLGDIVLASDAAFFKAGFTDLGVAADYGLGYTLPRAIGEPRAAEIIFSDRRVPAAEAFQLGFLSRLLPAEGFAEAALVFAEQMGRLPFGAKGTKGLLRLRDAEAFAAFLAVEAEVQADAFGSEDFREGARAFREKRRPTFQGR